MKVGGVTGQALCPTRILVEPLAQMHGLDAVEVGLQLSPGGAIPEPFDDHERITQR